MNPLEQAMNLYETMLEARFLDIDSELANVPILKPVDIGTFYSAITSRGQTAKPDYVTGRFIDTLIQNSYDNGMSDFVLTGDATWFPLATGLRGTPERHLKLTIEGRVGIIGYRAKYCIFDIQGE